MSFSETFDFWKNFYAGYAIYLGVTSVVSIFWVVFARNLRRADFDSSMGAAGIILRVQYKAGTLFWIWEGLLWDHFRCPSFNKNFTIARTTGVAMVTLAGIIVVWLQLVESLA